MFVKPGMRPDDRDRALVVRGPNGRILSELGGEVAETQFWHRRLRDGDVVAAELIPMADEIHRVGSDGTVSVEADSDAGPVESGLDPATPSMTADATP